MGHTFDLVYCVLDLLCPNRFMQITLYIEHYVAAEKTCYVYIWMVANTVFLADLHAGIHVHSIPTRQAG